MKKILPLLALLLASLGATADPVGEVSTTFKLLSPNDKVVVDVFDDPEVDGVSCYLSHAKTGGYKGALGLAEDTSFSAPMVSSRLLSCPTGVMTAAVPQANTSMISPLLMPSRTSAKVI